MSDPKVVIVTVPGPQTVVVPNRRGPSGGPSGGIPSTPNLFSQTDGAGGAVWGPITQDQVLASFAVSLSLSSASAVLLGSTVTHPAFTASYNRTPAAAVLTDDQGSSPKNVISTPNSFASNGAFTKNTFGSSATFTLTANEAGGPSKTSSQTITWLQPVYWGAAVPATINASFIQALSGSALASSRARTFSATAGATQKIYYAFRSAFGTPTFTVGGFTGGFSLVASAVAVTNGAGITENYDVWASDNVNLGATTVQVS
jgi:hypothetical protein